MEMNMNMKSISWMKCQYQDSFPVQKSQLPSTTTTFLKSFNSESADAFVAPTILHLNRSSKVECWAIKSTRGDQITPATDTATDDDELKENDRKMRRRMLTGAAAMVGAGVVIMMGQDKAAWALGPEGPLVEEFWENVRRYGLYGLTVSTGVLYAVLQPIVELLKNPVSAVLIILIFGGSFFLLSQILSAMFGVSDFAYQYAS